MMKTNVLILILIGFTFLSACQKSIQDRAPGVNQATYHGPSDGGGGDTCNGKLIESYRVDITTLAEYKNYVQPLLEKTAPPKADDKSGSPFLLSAGMKNWFIIDCKLKDIPDDRKGLYLETYQTAIHTSREIFIDSASYNSMAQDEKGKLLLHEMIMSYYLTKYLSIEDMCKISNSCSGDLSKVSNWKMFRPETYRPLNDVDHQKIRTVTSWLLTAGPELTTENFSKLLKNNDFDKRFELAGMGETESEEVEVEIQALVRMFKKHQWAKSFPQYCNFDKVTDVSGSVCDVEVEVDIRDYGVRDIKQLFVKLKIVRKKDGRTLAQEFSYPINETNKKIKLHKGKVGNVLSSASFGMMSNWPNYSNVVATEGLKSTMLLLMINMTNPEDLEIYQMMFQTYVWYSFEETIVVQDGFKYAQLYGYATPLPDESENLFVETELPYVFGSVLRGKIFLKSWLVP